MMARPKLGDGETERLQLKISAGELEAIETWRYENRVPSRSEAVRQLCEAGLLLDRIAPAIRDALEELEVARDGPEEDRKVEDFNPGIEALYRVLGPVLIGRLGIHTMSDMDIEMKNSPVVRALWNAARDYGESPAPSQGGTLERMQKALDERGPVDLKPSNDSDAAARRKGSKT